MTKLGTLPTLVFVATLAALCLATFFWVRNPMRKSETHIRDNLLAITPFGSSFDDVLATLRQRGYEPVPAPTVGLIREGADQEIVGAKSIRSSLGTYRSSLFELTSVGAFWGFDPEGKLIEVWVRKTVDGL